MTYTCIEYRFLNWTLPNNTVPVFLFYLATNSTGTIIWQYWENLQFKPTTIYIVIMLHWILKPWKDVNLQTTEIDLILCPRWFLSVNGVEVGHTYYSLQQLNAPSRMLPIHYVLIVVLKTTTDKQLWSTTVWINL